MLKSFDDSGIQFGWDATSIKIAEECLYKYNLKMLQGWQPERKSVHLIFGGHYATALENYNKYVAEGASPEDAELRVVHEALIATWEYDEDEEGNRIDGTGQPWQSDHNAKTRENLIRTIVWYLDQFGEDDPCSTVILSDGTPAVEHSFSFDAGNGIVLAGHLDRLVDMGGKIYVQDQKTTGTTITPRFFTQFDMDTQMSLYTMAGQIIFDLPIKGVMIDGAQIAVGFTRFERGFTFRDNAQLDEWFSDAMYHIDAAQEATVKQRFPMNRSSCDRFGGCQFKHVCSKSPAVRENFLKGDFVQGERWDPLESR